MGPPGAHNKIAALRADARDQTLPFAARPNRMVRFRHLSIEILAMADVVASEELRSFMLRLYSAWEAWDFEALREMF